MAARGLSSELYSCPDWYSYALAAKWLGISPTEDIPSWWIDKAIIAMSAENKARTQLQGN